MVLELNWIRLEFLAMGSQLAQLDSPGLSARSCAFVRVRSCWVKPLSTARGFRCVFARRLQLLLATAHPRGRSERHKRHEPSTMRPLVRGPRVLGSWLAGHCPWVLVLVWTGACYWNDVGGFMFNSPSSATQTAAPYFAPLVYGGY